MVSGAYSTSRDSAQQTWCLARECRWCPEHTVQAGRWRDTSRRTRSLRWRLPGAARRSSAAWVWGRSWPASPAHPWSTALSKSSSRKGVSRMTWLKVQQKSHTRRSSPMQRCGSRKSFDGSGLGARGGDGGPAGSGGSVPTRISRA